MADKGHQGFANMDEERQREVASEGGHASHEKGAAHEFNNQEAAEAGRRGAQARAMSHGSREVASGGQGAGGSEQGGGHVSSEGGSEHRTKRTRGGTHDQHVHAGKKGGSRIRQLIELGYKYEQEHGIGPGQNERSKLAAKRRSGKSGDGGEGSEADS